MPGSQGCQEHVLFAPPVSASLFWPHFSPVPKAWPLHETVPRPALGKYTAAAACPSCSQMHLLGVQALIHYFCTEPPLMAQSHAARCRPAPLRAWQLLECHCSGKKPRSPVGITGGMRLPGVGRGSLREAAAVRTATNPSGSRSQRSPVQPNRKCLTCSSLTGSFAQSQGVSEHLGMRMALGSRNRTRNPAGPPAPARPAQGSHLEVAGGSNQDVSLAGWGLTVLRAG